MCCLIVDRGATRILAELFCSALFLSCFAAGFAVGCSWDTLGFLMQVVTTNVFGGATGLFIIIIMFVYFDCFAYF